MANQPLWQWRIQHGTWNFSLEEGMHFLHIQLWEYCCELVKKITITNCTCFFLNLVVYMLLLGTPDGGEGRINM